MKLSTQAKNDIYIFDCKRKKLCRFSTGGFPGMEFGLVWADKVEYVDSESSPVMLRPEVKDPATRIKLKLKGGVIEDKAIEVYIKSYSLNSEPTLTRILNNWFSPKLFCNTDSVVVFAILLRIYPDVDPGEKDLKVELGTYTVEYAEPDVVDILTPEEYEYHCYDYMELNGFR